MTSAPMSPSDMAQKGPASTRVRSMTRTPASGGRPDVRRAADLLRAADAGLRARGLVFATGPPVPHAFADALDDGGDPLATRAGRAPVEARPVGQSHASEAEHGVNRFPRRVGARLHDLGGAAVP